MCWSLHCWVLLKFFPYRSVCELILISSGEIYIWLVLAQCALAELWHTFIASERCDLVVTYFSLPLSNDGSVMTLKFVHKVRHSWTAIFSRHVLPSSAHWKKEYKRQIRGLLLYSFGFYKPATNSIQRFRAWRYHVMHLAKLLWPSDVRKEYACGQSLSTPYIGVFCHLRCPMASSVRSRSVHVFC